MVYLHKTVVTDDMLKELAPLTHLTVLSLANTKITDAGLQALLPFKELQQLNLNNTNVTDAGLKDLVALSRLRKLELTGTGVTHAGVQEFKKNLPECEVVAAIVTVKLMDEPPQNRKNYEQEYFQPFKGEPSDKEAYTIRGKPELARLLKYEPQGLRITLPTNYSGGAAGTGLVFHCTVKGDFDITLSMENLKSSSQSSARNRTAKMTLGVFLDTPNDKNINEAHQPSHGRQGRHLLHDLFKRDRRAKGVWQKIQSLFTSRKKPRSAPLGPRRLRIVLLRHARRQFGFHVNRQASVS